MRVVLVNPQGEANLGAVARAMSTFSLARLVLVSPHAPVGEEARNWACHGGPVLDSCLSVGSLEQALEGVTLALALSRRRGKRRHRMTSLAGLNVESLLPAEVALVFGNEESGLSNQHLDLCQRTVFIPTDEVTGSMNLGHAVSVTLYELFGRQVVRPASKTREAPASPELVARMLREVADFLEPTGYPTHQATLEEEMTKLGDIVSRCRLEEWEVHFLLGILKQVRYSVGRRA